MHAYVIHVVQSNWFVRYCKEQCVFLKKNRVRRVESEKIRKMLSQRPKLCENIVIL